MEDFYVPADVPKEKEELFKNNISLATHNTGRLVLFAGDQKVEHLNADFSGENISPEDAEPKHLFQIASQAKIGVFASQLGLIAEYGKDYPDVSYLIKLNAKTNLLKTIHKDPLSSAWFSLEDIMEFKKTSGLKIMAVGYTLYLGSEYEAEMLREAAQIVHQAHTQGFFTVLWMYPRGKDVLDEKEPHIIAGAAGIAATLGSDFAKVNYPKEDGIDSAVALQEAVKAAGKTKVLCAGGSSIDVPTFLQTLHDQIHISGASGCATGRNIHQKDLNTAIRFCNSIYAITVENKSVQDALKIYNTTTEKNL